MLNMLEIIVPAATPSIFQVIWLILVAVLWAGFFFFEGFDFGVGMLVPFLGKSDEQRRVMINALGPHWDGNEVWLLTAGGAMFAAFPAWYATLFSGLYLPLLLVLLGLILRGVAFEYRSKNEGKLWRTVFDWMIAVGSFLPPLVFGVGFANFVKGVPVVPCSAHASIDFAACETAFGDPLLVPRIFWEVFDAFTLVGGLLFVCLFVAHGSFFIALKTRGEIKDRAQKFGNILGIVAFILAAVFVVWANLVYFGAEATPGQLPLLGILAWITGALAVVGIGFAWFMNSKNRDGWAFIGTTLGTVLLTVMFFCFFYPGLGFANIVDGAATMDITTASSSQHTLVLMTIAAGVLVPIVLAYTAWSYFFVFRRRLSVENIPA
ncbi:MAG: cytochrome d ubiquinol oxidase subunit II [Propionibacteriaceae bacterium]|jgi:cytochrome d ubiquinol oxidase subunit II|nr:cytochrome d ubiquinol oxidase subunit II [Propionibacteriaceae bacterium]